MLPMKANSLSSNLLKTPQTHPEVLKLCQNQALKLPKNFNLQIRRTFKAKIFQIIFLDLKVHYNQAQKPLESPRDYKLVKLYRFKPLKSWRTFDTNPWVQRTFIQIILPSLKVLLESSFKTSRTSKILIHQSFIEFKL